MSNQNQNRNNIIFWIAVFIISSFITYKSKYEVKDPVVKSNSLIITAKTQR